MNFSAIYGVFDDGEQFGVADAGNGAHSGIRQDSPHPSRGDGAHGRPAAASRDRQHERSHGEGQGEGEGEGGGAEEEGEGDGSVSNDNFFFSFSVDVSSVPFRTVLYFWN